VGDGALTGAVPQTGTPALAGGPYVFPVIGAVSFSDTWGAPRATVAWHHGVDIFAPIGTPVVAVADGTVFSVGWNSIGGRRLWLRDREGNYFYYAHLSGFSPLAREGARVWAGAVVGYVGDTGDAVGTPPHLHFEIHPASLLPLGYDGAVNPFPYVSAWQRLDGGLTEPAGPNGAGVARATAPTPGAILLGFTDISSASGLAPTPLADTIDGGGTAAVVVHEPESLDTPASAPAGAVSQREEDASIARSLDDEAARRLQHGAAVWDRLALCESSGDWSANTGNGYFGGLQFHPQTWTSHGGAAFAPSADLATREEQIAIAQRVLRTQGWRAWPVCSALLGLNPFAHD
jgi:murein DD-endopeptidase MepM/ murein hydrolase activator NlpD